MGRLGAAMESLLAVVPRNRVHVIVFEQLAQRPAEVWAALMEFLKLPIHPVPEFAVHNRNDKMYRSPTLRRLTHRPPWLLEAPIRKFRQFSRTTDSVLVADVKRRMWRAEKRSQISPDFRARILDYYREDTELLRELLGLDLSRWQQVRSETG